MNYCSKQGKKIMVLVKILMSKFGFCIRGWVSWYRRFCLDYILLGYSRQYLRNNGTFSGPTAQRMICSA
jgi:hypothetical protein